MKPLLAFMLLSALSANTFAAEFSVNNITWCNGPHSGPDGSNCPSFIAWNGVDLKFLKTLKLDLSGSQQFVKLLDSRGKSWQMDLKKCNNKPTDDSGCRYISDFKDTKNISVRISQWTYPYSPQDLTLNVKNENEIDLFGPDNSYFNFTVRKTR